MQPESDSQLSAHIRAAQITLPCSDLPATLDFFTERLGFRVELIFPADAPATAVISGFGVTLRLETEAGDNAHLGASVTLRLLCELSALPDNMPREFTAPGGLKIELVDVNPPLSLPPVTQELVISRQADETAWEAGRAGMQYRDLIPGRLGGRFVASHIRIPAGGEVPDYVHFHKVRFQMIYCKTGWARLVYEDQGAPFLLEAGDCVLQPPEIRHRVLEASPGLEVVEIGCPAIHETHADHELLLPTAQVAPERIFHTQRFVRHIARAGVWLPTGDAGFEFRDTGIAAATDGLAQARAIRAVAPNALTPRTRHTGEFLFLFVLAGELDVDIYKQGKHQLRAGDSCVIPSGSEYSLTADTGLELLEVGMPA